MTPPVELHRAHVRITEVGPRDGLQNEPGFVETSAKIRFVDLLSAASLPEIEVSSFVSPRWVPQLRDAAEVMAGIARRPGTIYSALVPNEQGLERALNARVDKVAVFVAASESFSQRNINASVEASLLRLAPVIAGARAAGRPVRGYVSCAVACPFEGPVAPAAVTAVVERLLGLGADEIDLGDTIGVAAPEDIERLYEGLDGVLAPGVSTLHLHDTHGRALACAARAASLGVRSFDASCAGLGGCPYAPGASGNVATEALVAHLASLGLSCGVDAEALALAGAFARSVLRPSVAPPSEVG